MEKGKIKWRLNLFDIAIICVAILAAVLILYLSRSGGGGAVLSGTQETVVYTVELEEMVGDTALLIKPGDSLVDKVEKRAMGTVVSVEVKPAVKLQKNNLTGGRVLAEVPGKKNAVVVITANATVTENQISIGGFIVRAGAKVSVNGPLYNGGGYIVDIERN